MNNLIIEMRKTQVELSYLLDHVSKITDLRRLAVTHRQIAVLRDKADALCKEATTRVRVIDCTDVLGVDQ